MKIEERLDIVEDKFTELIDIVERFIKETNRRLEENGK